MAFSLASSTVSIAAQAAGRAADGAAADQLPRLMHVAKGTFRALARTRYRVTPYFPPIAKIARTGTHGQEIQAPQAKYQTGLHRDAALLLPGHYFRIKLFTG
ncbi:hypothetical protein [Polaromonas jejuensis]|uniref:Uncharacterized protein n=1 Tax=Polaromonas jejuensis TaxID=457502 RepID=A0ABW0QCI1_9BURK|nr:hypothetical protein [Polaromonas jejuensis]